MKQRNFYPGSQWIYYKLYCSTRNADDILYILSHVVTILQRKCIIEKWFFIRYYDPHFHLRIRFFLTEEKKLEFIIPLIYKYTQQFINKKVIWKIQIDTYERELERYPHIELSETIFFIDSEMIVNIIKLIKNDYSIRWKLAINIIESYLSLLQLQTKEKVMILENISNSFKEEFGFNENNSQSINQSYRDYKSTIRDLIENEFDDKKYIKCTNIISQAINKMTLIHKEHNYLEITNYIHMSLNRLFVSYSKQNELILYSFLYKYYKSKLINSSKDNNQS